MSEYSQNRLEPAPLMGVGRGAMPSMQPSTGAHYSRPAGAASAPGVAPNYATQTEGCGRGISLQSDVHAAQQPGKSKKQKTLRMKPVTPELIKQYDNGVKNPISAVNEYCQVNRMSVTFNEVPAEGRFLTASFAYQCVVNGRSFPQGVAKTKKDAKTVAARNAFNDIIDETEANQANNFDDEEDESTDDELKTDQTTDKYALGNRHPVMMLNEYAAKKGMNLEVKVHDARTEYGFRCDIIIDDQLFKTAHANSKQEAKRLAGDEAIRELLANDALSQTETENLMHFDVMRNVVREKLDELWATLPASIPKPSRCAAFIVKRNPEHRGEVVAFGTGSNCLTGRNVKFNGRVIFDCHAEVIARRALIKWLYTQVNLVFKGQQAKSVLEMNDVTDKLRFRESVSLHLYLSGAPCGDSAAFHDSKNTILGEEEKRLIMEGEHLPNFENKAYGQLRVKLEFGLTTTPVVRLANELSFETYSTLAKSGEGIGRAANRKEEGDEQLRSMSCSDKIFKWNLLGVQGSLLSLYLEPVYINSITLGSEFNLGHLVRAVCCRLPSHVTLNDLPEGYIGDRHPIVGRVSIYDAPGPEKASGLQVSVNWMGDETNPLVEVVDCATGLSIPESPFKTGPTYASRLSKAGFFYRFNTLVKDTEQTDWLRPMYCETKKVSTTYNHVKDILYSEIERAGQGRWVSRPQEVENFGS